MSTGLVGFMITRLWMSLIYALCTRPMIWILVRLPFFPTTLLATVYMCFSYLLFPLPSIFPTYFGWPEEFGDNRIRRFCSHEVSQYLMNCVLKPPPPSVSSLPIPSSVAGEKAKLEELSTSDDVLSKIILAEIEEQATNSVLLTASEVLLIGELRLSKKESVRRKIENTAKQGLVCKSLKEICATASEERDKECEVRFKALSAVSAKIEEQEIKKAKEAETTQTTGLLGKESTDANKDDSARASPDSKLIVALLEMKDAVRNLQEDVYEICPSWSLGGIENFVRCLMLIILPFYVSINLSIRCALSTLKSKIDSLSGKSKPCGQYCAVSHDCARYKTWNFGSNEKETEDSDSAFLLEVGLAFALYAVCEVVIYYNFMFNVLPKLL